MGPSCAPLALGLAEAHRPAAVFRGGSSRSGLTVGAGQHGWGLATGLALGPRTPWQVWSGCSGRSLPSSRTVAIDAPSRTPGISTPAGMFLGLWGAVGVGVASSRPGGRGGEEGAAVQPLRDACPVLVGLRMFRLFSLDWSGRLVARVGSALGTVSLTVGAKRGSQAQAWGRECTAVPGRNEGLDSVASESSSPRLATGVRRAAQLHREPGAVGGWRAAHHIRDCGSVGI